MADEHTGMGPLTPAPKLDPHCQCICHTQPGVMHVAACCTAPDLIPRADADLAVAEAIRRAADACVDLADQVSDAALTGLPEQARLRESMAAAFTKASHIIRALADADALVEAQRLREAVEALVVVLDRNDKKGPIPDVEMMFCWLAAQGVRAAFRKIAQKGEAT